MRWLLVLLVSGIVALPVSAQEPTPIPIVVTVILVPASATPTETPTETPIPSETPTPTITPTPSDTPTPTATATNTPSLLIDVTLEVTEGVFVDAQFVNRVDAGQGIIAALLLGNLMVLCVMVVVMMWQGRRQQ